MPSHRIWCNQKLSDEAQQLLDRYLSGHVLVMSQPGTRSNLEPPLPDRLIQGCDIAFGQPDPQDILDSPRLRWVQISAAGYTRYDRDDLRRALRDRGAVLTNSSSVYSDPCAQHVLAMMLGLSRRLPQSLLAQQEQRWDHRVRRSETRVLSGDRVLVVGFGAIGRRLVALLSPFGMKIVAVRRNVRGDERVQTHRMDEIDRLLPSADHIVDLLPAGPNTERYFDSSRFALMQPGARFYNVGRGDTVDQQALIDSLVEGHLAEAYIDVTTPEPLPPGHPLWTVPNCFITPHIAGGYQVEHEQLVRHFLANLTRFDGAEPLLDRIY